MHADLRRISGVESGHITARPIFCRLRNGVIATMIEKLEESLVRRTIINLFQHLVDFGKEVAGAGLVSGNAQDVAIYFCSVQVVARKQAQSYRWFAVDELGAWFDRRVTAR